MIDTHFKNFNTYILLNTFSFYGSGDGLALLADLRAPDQTVIMIWLAMTALGAVIGMVASVVALSRFLDV